MTITAPYIIANIATILAVLFWLGGLGDDKFARRCKILSKLLAIVAVICFIIWIIKY